MEHPVTAARRKIAARLEAEIIDPVLVNPYGFRIKSKVERAIRPYICGAISRKALRARLADIASGLRQ